MSDHNDARALRIIVVDDEEDFTALISDVFELLGFSVQTCATAAAARPLVAAGCDAVITDVSLGAGESGLALCEQLRDEHPDVHVFVLSGDPRNDEAAKRLGATGFWLKPADPTAMAEAIRAACGD